MRLPLATLLAVAFAPAALANPFVERLDPPAVSPGKVTRVKATGSGLGNAAGLWSTLPAGKLDAKVVGTPSATEAEFDVTAAPDTPVGVAGLRIASVDGLGNACLFLVDDLPLAPVPPVGADGKPATVKLPAALWSGLREGETQRIRFDVTAGQRVSIEVVANRLGRDDDPLVTLRGPDGKVVAECDNSPGLYFDCRFDHTFASAGTVTLELRDARFRGGPLSRFVLRLGRFPAARVAVPSVVRPGTRTEVRLPELGGEAITVEVPKDAPEGPFFAALKRDGDDGSAWLPLSVRDADAIAEFEPNNAWPTATAAKLPAALCGVLGEPGDRDCFRFAVDKPTRIHVRAESRLMNSPAELEVAVLDATGKEVHRAANVGDDEVTFAYNLNPGTWGLSVREVHRDGSPAHAYRLDVRVGPPPVVVTAEVEGLTIPQGSWQSFPVVLTRGEHAGPVRLALVGSPAGLTLTPNEVPTGVDKLICRLAAAPDAPVRVGGLQVVAEPVAAAGMSPPPVPPASLLRTRPLIERTYKNVDLIPYALREEQRRLPPALADRFAVQVTPPAPFTIELPEANRVLARYLSVDIPIKTTRAAGFDGPITFRAAGGPMGPKEELRSALYPDLPPAMAGTLDVTGALRSRILLNTGKHRVDVWATGTAGGREVTLMRSFDLEIRSAFEVSPAEPGPTKVEAGGTARVRLKVDRISGFAGAVTIRPRGETWGLPDELTIPAGQESVEAEVRIPAGRGPGRISVSLTCTGQVGGFEESRDTRIELEVPPPPKK